MPAIAVTHGGLIAPGESNVGQISETMAHNEWRVQGQANSMWTVEVTRLTGDLTPQIAIVGPNGAVLQDSVSEIDGSLSVPFQVPANGTYGIEVTRAGHTVGDYTITLREG
jgi:hypothetical protein